MLNLQRGAVTKKKRENLGKIPKGGGGEKKEDENSQFQFGNFENPTPYMAFSIQIRLFRCLSEGVGCRRYVLNFKHFL